MHILETRGPWLIFLSIFIKQLMEEKKYKIFFLCHYYVCESREVNMM